jgi:hypothetical protein
MTSMPWRTLMKKLTLLVLITSVVTFGQMPASRVGV